MFSKLIYNKIIASETSSLTQSEDASLLQEQPTLSPNDPQLSKLKLILTIALSTSALGLSLYGTYWLGYNKANESCYTTKLELSKISAELTESQKELKTSNTHHATTITQCHNDYKKRIRKINSQHKLELEMAPLNLNELCELFNKRKQEYNEKYGDDNKEIHDNIDTTNLTKLEIAQFKYDFAKDRYEMSEIFEKIANKAQALNNSKLTTNEQTQFDEQEQLIEIMSGCRTFQLISERNYDKLRDAKKSLQDLQEKQSPQ